MIENLLQRFGVSDALYRGTSLASNLSYWAFVALIPGFGPNGVLFSGTVQLLVSGVLEVPTSLIADRFGRERSVAFGFALKIFVTLSLAGAVFAAISGNTALARTFLVCEAVLDALANSLLSGAYQASYSDWYRKRFIDAQTSPSRDDVKEAMPPLFLASFKYGILIRIAIPVFVLSLGGFYTAGKESGSSPSDYVLLSSVLIAFLLVMRCVVLWRTTRDLEGMSNARADGGLNWRTMSSTMKSAFKSNPSDLIFYTLSSFITYSVGLFLIGKIFLLLKEQGGSDFLSWTGGFGIGLGIQLLSILGGRALFPKLNNSRLSNRFISSSSAVIAALACGTALVLTMDLSKFSQCILLFGYSSVVLFLSQGMQRAILSLALNTLPEDVKATWTSIAETFAHLAVALVFGILFVLGPDADSVLIMVGFSALFSFLVFSIWAFRSGREMGVRKVTIESYLGKRFLIAVVSIATVVSIIDLITFSRTLSSITDANHESAADLISTSLREPLVQGSFIEGRARVQDFVKGGKAACVEVVVWQDVLTDCKEIRAESGSFVSKSRELRFSSVGGERIGHVTVIFDNGIVRSLIWKRLGQSVAAYLFFAIVLLVFLRSLSLKVKSEAAAVVRRLENNDVQTPSDVQINMYEFSQLSTELSAIMTRLNKASKDAALARMTQMLAHDVRKPFSMFKSIIQIVEGAEEPQEIREILRLTLPEVNQAMASVEGMISDVMQIGAEIQMHTEDIQPETLVESALVDLFRIFPEADLAISYSFSHRHMVKVDSLRMSRVFANILVNAAQANGKNGNIWIHTDEGTGFVTFTIGNSGSFIPEESILRLFDAFFTSGKKGGTGLGLAIAKKIVEAHGGTILCVSEKNASFPEGKVEFKFTLPLSHSVCEPSTSPLPLPRTSREFQEALLTSRLTSAVREKTFPDRHEEELEIAILARIEQLNLSTDTKIVVLAVEDEAVYRNGLQSLLSRSPALSARVRMVFAQNDAEAFVALKESMPVLVIEDVDLGPSSRSGIDIVKTLRAHEFTGHICVHSNRFLPEDNKAALAAGADSVLPKPLGRAHFLKLLLASLPSVESDTKAASAPEARPSKLSVAMLDDSISMRMAWKMELKDKTEFRAFAGTDAFLELCDKEPSYLSTLDVVISDYNFAPGDPHNGGTFACVLRARGYQGLILKASGETDLGADIEAYFDADVGKSALEWPEFKAIVESSQKNRRLA